MMRRRLFIDSAKESMVRTWIQTAWAAGSTARTVNDGPSHKQPPFSGHQGARRVPTAEFVATLHPPCGRVGNARQRVSGEAGWLEHRSSFHRPSPKARPSPSTLPEGG